MEPTITTQAKLPPVASQSWQRVGGAWVPLDIKYRVPALYYGSTWKEAEPITSRPMQWDCGPDETWWRAGGWFGSDQPLVYSGGMIYQYSEGFLGDPEIYLSTYDAGQAGDIRALAYLDPATTYQMQARLAMTKVSSGTDPMPASYSWSWNASQGDTWESPERTTSTGWLTLTSPSFKPFNPTATFAPRFTVLQSAVVQTAVWRLQVDWCRLLIGGSVAYVWSGGGFFVRHAGEWWGT
jgi:hypothetical protein